MLAFLQNPWVVGIGGGIVSGIIVYFITSWLYKRKDNSKYLEQISRANLDIIQALKPYVAERGLLEKEIVDAIIVSTARKYKVKSDELYSIRIICEELIREIVENAYVSSEKKQEYAKQLQEYLHKLDTEKSRDFLISDIEKEIKNLTVFKESNYRRKTATMLSALLSAFAGIVTVLVTFVAFLDTNTFNVRNSTNEFWTFATIIALTTTVFVVLYSVVLIMVKARKNRTNKSETHSKTEEM